MVNEVTDGENKCPLLWNIVTSTSRGGRLVGVGVDCGLHPLSQNWMKGNLSQYCVKHLNYTTLTYMNFEFANKVSAKVPETKKKEVLSQHLLWRISLLPVRIRDGTKCQSSWDSSQKHNQKTSSLSFIASWQKCFISAPPGDALNNLNRNTRSGDRNGSGSLFPMSAISPSGELEYLFLITYPPTQLRVKCKCNSRMYLSLVSRDASHTF